MTSTPHHFSPDAQSKTSLPPRSGRKARSKLIANRWKAYFDATFLARRLSMAAAGMVPENFTPSLSVVILN